MNKLKEEQVKKWDMLVSDLEENQIPEVALLLENQRLFNESDERLDTDFKWPEGELGESYKDSFEQFSRVSIPMVRRIYGEGLWPLYKMVSVLSTPSPGFYLTYEDLKGKLVDVNSAVKTRGLVTRFSAQEDAEQIAKWAVDISLEILREVFSDLRTNSGWEIEHEWSSSTKLAVALLTANGEVERRIDHAPTWVATSQDMADELVKNMDFEESKEGSHEFYKGRLAKKWDLFVDSMSLSNDITVGYKGNAFQAGYFYCPYIPLGLWEDKYLVTRYNKKMVPGGENYYATIQVHNYSHTEEETDG